MLKMGTGKTGVGEKNSSQAVLDHKIEAADERDDVDDKKRVEGEGESIQTNTAPKPWQNLAPATRLVTPSTRGTATANWRRTFRRASIMPI